MAQVPNVKTVISICILCLSSGPLVTVIMSEFQLSTELWKPVGLDLYSEVRSHRVILNINFHSTHNDCTRSY